MLRGENRLADMHNGLWLMRIMAAFKTRKCALQALEPEGSLGMDTVVAILGKFLYLFAASLILGLCFGLGTAFLLKTLKCQSSPQVHPS